MAKRLKSLCSRRQLHGAEPGPCEDLQAGTCNGSVCALHMVAMHAPGGSMASSKCQDKNMKGELQHAPATRGVVAAWNSRSSTLNSWSGGMVCSSPTRVLYSSFGGQYVRSGGAV